MPQSNVLVFVRASKIIKSNWEISIWHPNGQSSESSMIDERFSRFDCFASTAAKTGEDGRSFRPMNATWDRRLHELFIDFENSALTELFRAFLEAASKAIGFVFDLPPQRRKSRGRPTLTPNQRHVKISLHFARIYFNISDDANRLLISTIIKT